MERLSKKRNEKSLSAFINTQMDYYQNGKDRAHIAAVTAMSWACEQNGSANLLTLVHGLLTGNDKDRFRTWVGKASAFTFIDEQGVESSKQFIGYREKTDGKNVAGFYIKSGAAFMTARGNVDSEALRTGSRFFDKIDSDKPTVTLAMLLKMLADIEKRTDSRADKANVVIPAEVVAQVKALAHVAQNAAKHLN